MFSWNELTEQSQISTDDHKRTRQKFNNGTFSSYIPATINNKSSRYGSKFAAFALRVGPCRLSYVSGYFALSPPLQGQLFHLILASLPERCLASVDFRIAGQKPAGIACRPSRSFQGSHEQSCNDKEDNTTSPHSPNLGQAREAPSWLANIAVPLFSPDLLNHPVSIIRFLSRPLLAPVSHFRLLVLLYSVQLPS